MANIKFKIGSTFYSIPTIKGDKGDAGAISDLGGVIAGLTAKTIPVDADSFVISDSASANVEKKLTFANIKSTLKTYFETLFPTMTTGNISYYVSPTGSNSNDGLTAGTPFLTIAYALSKIPKNIRHTITINVASGTYNETVYVQGYYGEGRIQIFGGTDLATAINFKINGLNISNNLIYVSVRGFEALITTEVPFLVYSSSRVRLEYLISSVGANTVNGFYIVSSKVFVGTCSISNKIVALSASENSDVYSTNFATGSGNNYGLYAMYGSKIIKYGTQPQGTNAEFATDGGLITSGILNPAPLASPAFTGTPTAPTAVAGTNTTQIATTAFVKALGDTKANTSHTHATSDVTGLDTTLAGKASSIHTHTISDVTGLQTALDGKAIKAVAENKTLLASAWVGASAPFTLDLAVTGVTATSIQDWSTGLSITSAELLALQKANIVDGGQSAGTVTFKAFGVKPTIDIPIIVVKRGD